MADHAHGGGGHGPRLDISLALIIGVILSVAYLVHIIKSDRAELVREEPIYRGTFVPVAAPPAPRYERHEFVRSRPPRDAIPGNWNVVNR